MYEKGSETTKKLSRILRVTSKMPTCMFGFVFSSIHNHIISYRKNVLSALAVLLRILARWDCSLHPSLCTSLAQASFAAHCPCGTLRRPCSGKKQILPCANLRGKCLEKKLFHRIESCVQMVTMSWKSSRKTTGHADRKTLHPEITSVRACMCVCVLSAGDPTTHFVFVLPKKSYWSWVPP